MTTITKISPKQMQRIYWRSFTFFIGKQKVETDMKDGGGKELKYMELTAHSSKDGDSSSSETSCDTLESGIAIPQPANWLPPEYVSIRADLSSVIDSPVRNETSQSLLLTSKTPQIIVSPPSCSPIKNSNSTLGKLIASPLNISTDEDDHSESDRIQEEWKSELFNDDEEDDIDESVSSCSVQRWMLPEYEQHGKLSADSNSYIEKLFPNNFIPTLGAIEEEDENSDAEATESGFKRFGTMEDLSTYDTESDTDLEDEKEYVLDHSHVQNYEVKEESEQEIMVDDIPIKTLQIENKMKSQDVNVQTIENDTPPSSSPPAHGSSTASASFKTSPSSGIADHSDYASTVTDSAYSSHEAIFKYNMDTDDKTTLGILSATSSPELANLHEESTIDYIPVSYATEASAKRKRKRRRATYASTSNAILSSKKQTMSENSPKQKTPKSGISFGTIRKRLSWRKADRISSSTPNLTTKAMTFSPQQSPVSTQSTSSSNLPKVKRTSNKKRLRRAMSSIVRRFSSRRLSRNSRGSSSKKEKTILEEDEGTPHTASVAKKHEKSAHITTSIGESNPNKLSTLPVSCNGVRPKVHERNPHEGARARSYSTPGRPTTEEADIINCTDDSDVITEVNLSANTIII